MMPGLAANPSIFEYIKLPNDRYDVHWLTWSLPEKKESMESYARRMCEQLQHENPVLIGVSFGGILVQEMSKQISTEKTVIVSSVKRQSELPKRMRIARATQLHKILPTQLVQNFETLAKYTVGGMAPDRIELYKKYLSIRDKQYLDWAIDQVVNWKQPEPLKDVVHIHGDKDAVFPIGHIDNCIRVKGGTHTMIIQKHKWFNENLPRILGE